MRSRMWIKKNNRRMKRKEGIDRRKRIVGKQELVDKKDMRQYIEEEVINQEDERG